MKKEWIKPEVTSLGMENTNEECLTKDDKGLLWHQCDHCGKIFLCDHAAEIAHEKDCYANPAHKPVNPLPGEGEGLVPMS